MPAGYNLPIHRCTGSTFVSSLILLVLDPRRTNSVHLGRPAPISGAEPLIRLDPPALLSAAATPANSDASAHPPHTDPAATVAAEPLFPIAAAEPMFVIAADTGPLRVGDGETVAAWATAWARPGPRGRPASPRRGSARGAYRTNSEGQGGFRPKHRRTRRPGPAFPRPGILPGPTRGDSDEEGDRAVALVLSLSLTHSR
jgi:hypothetical protein